MNTDFWPSGTFDNTATNRREVYLKNTHDRHTNKC